MALGAREGVGASPHLAAMIEPMACAVGVYDPIGGASGDSGNLAAVSTGGSVRVIVTVLTTGKRMGLAVGRVTAQAVPAR